MKEVLITILPFSALLAPYKAVTKRIEKAAEGDEVLLTCQSEGYPGSPVSWQDGHFKSITSNTTAVSTPDQLLRITSQIRVSLSEKNNYTCDFKTRGHSATFLVPGTYLKKICFLHVSIRM